MEKNNLLGREVKIIYDDLGKPTPKTGVVISKDAEFIIIKTEKGEEAFPINKIMRMELGK